MDETTTMHYACAGQCGGVADTAQVCGSEACPQNGQTFAECGCGDMANHSGTAMTEAGDMEVEEMDEEEAGTDEE